MNPTPTNDQQLLILCDQVVAGCERIGSEIGLGVEVGSRLNLAAVAARERLAEVKRAKPRRSKRRAEFRALDRQGEQVIGRCRLRLAAVYGSRHNAQWQAAGFTNESTMVPEDFAARLKVLSGLAGYFQKQPQLESQDMGATALICGEMQERLVAGRKAVTDSETKLRQVVVAKRAALQVVRTALREAIKILGGLLTGDDARWLAFGLKPPKAGAAEPRAVESVTLTPLGGGSMEVSWPAALHAEVYQVQARLMGSSEFKVVKTVRAREVELGGWPAGQIVEVRIVATNALGEAVPSPVMALWLT